MCKSFNDPCHLVKYKLLITINFSFFWIYIPHGLQAFHLCTSSEHFSFHLKKTPENTLSFSIATTNSSILPFLFEILSRPSLHSYRTICNVSCGEDAAVGGGVVPLPPAVLTLIMTLRKRVIRKVNGRTSYVPHPRFACGHATLSPFWREDG